MDSLVISLVVAPTLALAAGSNLLDKVTIRDSYECFTVRGAVAPDAGHPTFRITPETKSGLLALSERDSDGAWVDPLPANVRRLFPPDETALETMVSGDFVVCPLEGPRPGGLRLARIASARNLHRQTKRWLTSPR